MVSQGCRGLSRHHRLLGGVIAVFGTILLAGSQSRLQAHVRTEHKVALNNQTGINVTAYSCSFRDYHKERLYGLTDPAYPEAFLRSSFYIHGKPPKLLLLPNQSGFTKKICHIPAPLDYLQPYKTPNGGKEFRQLSIPLTDGTNPSLLSFERLLHQMDDAPPWMESVLQKYPTAAYLATLNFKSSQQCQYSSKHKPYLPKHLPGRTTAFETELLILDDRFQTLLQTTILQNATSELHNAADDGKLFFHDGSIWLLHKRYGTGHRDDMFLARLDIHYSMGQQQLRAYPVEEHHVCCGRNFMALPSPTGTTRLSLMTWPDPVWVQQVDTATTSSNLGTLTDPPRQSHRRLAKHAMRRPRFHGTSAFLLEFSETELLGIGHIHRNRLWSKDKHQDAFFGHHYRHSFFTISRNPPHILLRLSQEYVFPTQVRNRTGEGDIIQYASGLEYVPDSEQQDIAIGYGINDCEAAVLVLHRNAVEELLVSVLAGTQVSTTMTNLTREAFHVG